MGRPPLSIDIAPKHQKELAKLLSGAVSSSSGCPARLGFVATGKGRERTADR
jgi:hypothetical protein